MEQAKIASALVKAQKSFGPALKNAANGGIKGSKYADLSSCVDAVMDALNANGIMLMQIPHECDNGALVETVFLHESGEEMRAGKTHVPASKQDAHGYGSAMTYARRYGLMAACGIAPEDDDGNAATKAAPVKQSHADVKTIQLREADLLKCTDLATLKASFGAAWQLAANDEAAREKLKGAYESRKAILEQKVAA